LVNGVNSQLNILATHALPVPATNAVPESRTYCSIPDCTTNTFEEVEDISFFTPQNVIFITIHKYYFKLIIDGRLLLFLLLIL